MKCHLHVQNNAKNWGKIKLGKDRGKIIVKIWRCLHWDVEAKKVNSVLN